MERPDSPSMLDALAAEAREIMDLQAEASRISIEAVRKAGLLFKQLEHMANEARSRATTAPITVNAPLAPAEAEECLQPGLAVERPEPPTMPERALAMFAETDLTTYEIAKRIGATWRAVGEYIRAARKAADPRAAQGDLRRQPDDGGIAKGSADEPPVLPLARPTEEIHQQPPYIPSGPGLLAEENVTYPAAEVGMPLAELNLRDREVTVDGNTIQVSRPEFRIVHLLNEQAPTKLDALLKHVPIVSAKLLRRDIAKLNPTLSAVGLTVFEHLDNTFQLRRLPAA